MISAQRIEWNGMESLEFDLITCLSFDSDNGNTPSFLNQDGIYTEHYDGRRTIHRAKTNEYFTPTFTFVKEGSGDFTIEEQRRILSWLSIETPGWLNVYHDDSNVLSYRCFGTWEEIELYKLGNGRVVGYVVSFASSHPYAWSRKLIYPEVYATVEEINNNDETNDYLVVSGTKPFTITCDSDEYNKLLYPKVTIVFDEKNIKLPVTTDPQDENYVMIPNVLYSYNNNLYININKGDIEDQGKYSVSSEELDDSTPASEKLLGQHYYFPKDRTVRKVVKGEKVPYVWKTVSIVGAAVEINNTTVSKKAIVSGGALGETVVLDGTNKIISGVKGTVTRIVGDNFNWEWIPLAYGDNNITVTGNCKIKFEWIEPRKVGSL